MAADPRTGVRDAAGNHPGASRGAGSHGHEPRAPGARLA